MANAAKTDVVNSANVLIRNQCNAGISWGSNNYPSGSLAGWFAGTTAGNQALFDLNNPAFQQQPTGRAMTNALNAFVGNFAYIRLMRIVIYYNNNGSLQVRYDGTAVAHSTEPVGGLTADLPPTINTGDLLSLGQVNDYCQRLFNRYNSAARGSAILRTNTLCHTSCHSNCHGSRGRR